MFPSFVDGADLVITWKRENGEPEIDFIPLIFGPTGVHKMLYTPGRAKAQLEYLK